MLSIVSVANPANHFLPSGVCRSGRGDGSAKLGRVGNTGAAVNDALGLDLGADADSRMGIILKEKLRIAHITKGRLTIVLILLLFRVYRHSDLLWG